MKRAKAPFLLSVFWRDRRGNFAIMTAFMMFVLIVVGGMGVDYSRAQMAKSRLQFAVDSGGLAIGQIFRTYDDPAQAVVDFIESNIEGSVIDPSTLEIDTTIEDTPTSRQVNITAKASVETLFTHFFGVEKYDVTAETETYEAYQELEVSIVLDISGSMAGSKLTELRNAAKLFVDTLLETEEDQEYRVISVIPYGGGVQFPDDFARFLKPQYEPTYWNGCFDFDDTIYNDNLLDEDTLDPYPHLYSPALCPQGDMRAIFFENDPDVLKNHIDKLTVTAGSTGSDIASAWGLKALSPKWRGEIDGAPADVPADYGDVVKALVIMTDGGVNGQIRRWGYDYMDHFGPGDPSDRWPNVPWNYGNYYKYSNSQSRINFEAVCDEAQSAEGVQIYTVGFEVSATWMLDTLKNCATSPRNYSEAKSGELEAVFEAIALSLDPLKLRN